MDFPEDVRTGTSTTAEVSAGDLVTSQLETGTDTDWFQIELVQGDRYQFDLSGAGSSGALSDPLLRLYQGNQLIAQDDNGGPGLDPRIIFTAPSTGT